jgi:hypothetical protein
MKQVEVGFVACGESFKAIILVREEQYFRDGVLLEAKLRDRLSCNMVCTSPIANKHRKRGNNLWHRADKVLTSGMRY